MTKPVQLSSPFSSEGVMSVIHSQTQLVCRIYYTHTHTHVRSHTHTHPVGFIAEKSRKEQDLHSRLMSHRGHTHSHAQITHTHTLSRTSLTGSPGPFLASLVSGKNTFFWTNLKLTGSCFRNNPSQTAKGQWTTGGQSCCSTVCPLVAELSVHFLSTGELQMAHRFDTGFKNI